MISIHRLCLLNDTRYLDPILLNKLYGFVDTDSDYGNSGSGNPDSDSDDDSV